MGYKRNRRSKRGQSPSVERDLRASEAEASQGNETMIETLSNFDKVSSVRSKEDVLIFLRKKRMKCKRGQKALQITQTKKWQN